MNATVLYHYRRYRALQLETYGNSNIFRDEVDQREFTGGGAAYGRHALAAYNYARSHIHFTNNHDIKI